MMARLSRDKILLGLSIVFLAVMALKRGDQMRTYELFIKGPLPNEVYDKLVNFGNIATLNKRM